MLTPRSVVSMNCSQSHLHTCTLCNCNEDSARHSHYLSSHDHNHGQHALHATRSSSKYEDHNAVSNHETI